jgi:small subunit ribosomal protein S5
MISHNDNDKVNQPKPGPNGDKVPARPFDERGDKKFVHRDGRRRQGDRTAKPEGTEEVVDPANEESRRGGSELIEQVISINRITKVTKGGKKLSFSALVVVGDTKGNVGYSLEKASEVSIAIKKSIASAKKNMIRVPMKGTTITHEIIGVCGGSKVMLKPASEGTGVIAAGPVRAVCDGAGIRDILTKCHRSNNPVNVVKATIDGLQRLKQVI